jgi:hypothetical protein
MFPDHKKSRARLEAIEEIEQLRRDSGIRTIIESKSQLARRVCAANSRTKKLRARIDSGVGGEASGCGR